MSSPRPRIHPAWLVAAVTLVCLLVASAFRSSAGVLLQPLEDEFGWSRAATSGAASLNLVVYGLAAPFAAAVMELWGPRRTVSASLLVVGLAAVASLFMDQAWQLWLLWGLVIGLGTGALALTFGAIVANRWFARHLGLVTGAFSAATAAGQVLFVPVVAQAVAGPGWRVAVGTIAALTLLCAVLCWRVVRDWPGQAGVEALGTGRPGSVPAAQPTDECPRGLREPLRSAVSALTRNWRRPAMVILLVSFAICGWSTNGIIQTHFVPAAHDHSMPATTAAGVIGLIGIFDVLGTVASGWLTDRYDPRWLLAVYYGLRGLSLIPINQMLEAHMTPALWLFVVFYGLDWTATVPPTIALCREHFGIRRSGVVFGWVYAAHMVGAGLGASVSGLLRSADGTYTRAWMLTAALCLGAAVLVLLDRRPRGPVTATPA